MQNCKIAKIPKIDFFLAKIFAHRVEPFCSQCHLDTWKQSKAGKILFPFSQSIKVGFRLYFAYPETSNFKYWNLLLACHKRLLTLMLTLKCFPSVDWSTQWKLQSSKNSSYFSRELTFWFLPWAPMLGSHVREPC